MSPFDTSIRLLPNVIIGVILNLSTGLFVHLVQVNYLVIVVSIIAAIAPLLMAIIDPNWNYWICAFWGVLLGPVAIDGMHGFVLPLPRRTYTALAPVTDT